MPGGVVKDVTISNVELNVGYPAEAVNDDVESAGKPDTDKVTGSETPLIKFTVIKLLPDAPCVTMISLFFVIEKSKTGCGSVTLTLNIAFLIFDPPVPVIVIL